MMKQDLIEIIKRNSKMDRNYSYDECRVITDECRVITDDNILDIVDEIQLLIKKHMVELDTKITVYETFIGKSNFRAFTKKEKKDEK